MRAATTPAPAGDDVPVAGSFAVAAQLRMTTTGTTTRVSVALPEDMKATPATLVQALRAPRQQVLVDYRLTGRELPEVEVTAVERVETVPATATVTGFTLGVINDLATRRSAIAVDSDLLLGNDGGVLLIAATLPVGATNDHHIHGPPGQKNFQAPAGSFLTSCRGASPRTGSGRS